MIQVDSGRINKQLFEKCWKHKKEQVLKKSVNRGSCECDKKMRTHALDEKIKDATQAKSSGGKKGKFEQEEMRYVCGHSQACSQEKLYKGQLYNYTGKKECMENRMF